VSTGVRPGEFNRAHKSIASARHGLDEARRPRRIVESLPDFCNRGIQAVLEIDVSAVRPQLLAKFLACNNFATTVEQQGKNLEWLFLQLYTKAKLLEYPGCPVQFERAKSSLAPTWFSSAIGR